MLIFNIVVQVSTHKLYIFMSSLISSVWKKDMFPLCVTFIHIFSIYFSFNFEYSWI